MEHVYRELKKVDPEVKVILASGYSMDGQAGELQRVVRLAQQQTW